MNLTLHWLRRDLHRHALLILLWALLVALFTWARVWFRTHPERFIGDRDLWLSLPAAGLGIAEVCLLLRILLDDPARGAQVFWKTRPPSGGAVFAAKAVIIALVALVIPLTAEAVFLAAVGESAGTPERLSLYLLPPALALMAGGVSKAWKDTLLWLPVVLGVPAAAAVLVVWMDYSGRIDSLADYRVVAAAFLISALGAGALLYRRSCGRGTVSLALTAPVLAGFCVAGSGLPADARRHSPPRGMRSGDVQVSWLRPPAIETNNMVPHPWLNLPLQLNGLPSDGFYGAELKDIEITAKDRTVERARNMFAELHSGYFGKPGKGPDFSIELTDAERQGLAGRHLSVSATLVLRVFERRRHRVALDERYELTMDDGTWLIGPGTWWPLSSSPAHRDHGALRPVLPYTYRNTKALPRERLNFIDPESAVLIHGSEVTGYPQSDFQLWTWFLVWEGAGNGSNPLKFGPRLADFSQASPAAWSEWRLEFDMLTFSGTLEVPFSLSFSLPPAQP